MWLREGCGLLLPLLPPLPLLLMKQLLLPKAESASGEVKAAGRARPGSEAEYTESGKPLPNSSPPLCERDTGEGDRGGVDSVLAWGCSTWGWGPLWASGR